MGDWEPRGIYFYPDKARRATKYGDRLNLDVPEVQRYMTDSAVMWLEVRR